jgi:site-specific DNA-methyltransferase (adenine-specific)
MADALAIISRYPKELAKCEKVEEAIDVLAKIRAATAYAKSTQQVTIKQRNECTVAELIAERRVGELLMVTVKRGGDQTDSVSVCSQVGVSHKQSSRWQSLAAIPQDEFNQAIERLSQSGGVVSKTAIVRMGEALKRSFRDAAKQEAPDPTTPGDWRIINGDVLDGLEQIRQSGERARLIFTDPPYNIGIDYGDGKEADLLSDDDYMTWVEEWLDCCRELLTDDGSLWVMIGDEYAAEYCVMLKRMGLTLRSWIKWYETFGVNCSHKFNRTSRHIFYFVKDPKRFVFNREPVTRPSDRQTKYGDKRASEGGKNWDDVWEIPRLTGTSIERVPSFPTQLPLRLVRPIVECASDIGDLVIDPFNGSGTTGVAAIETGRRYIGVELSADFATKASARLSSAQIPFMEMLR